MRLIHFLIPDPSAFPSGGNVYNARLMQALIARGEHISHNTFRPEIMLASPDTLYILDSIYFGKIDEPERQIPSRCIGLIHHLNSLYPLSEEYFQQKEKSFLSHFSGFIVTSSFTFHYLTDRGFDPSRISLIEPAPNIQPAIQRTRSRDVRALMLGSCIPRKGQLNFLNALAQSDLPPTYSMTIAGSLTADMEYAKRCKEIIEHNSSLKSCVQLLGEQEASAIQHLYDQSNLYVSSSEMETFGMAIQDAVVCGMPVMALEGGYAAEHISHGVNGYKCSTLEQLVAEFRRCVTDSNHFLSLQERAASFLPSYHMWDDAAKKVIEVFMF